MTNKNTPKKSRRLRRFFSPEPLQSVGQWIYLSLSDSRHLTEVLRLQKGDECELTDGRGRSAKAKVEGSGPNGEARLMITALAEARAETMKLYYYPALLQKGKLDTLVEKAQELAVAQMIPIETERTILKMDEAAKKKVTARWEKIAREASKQSGSNTLLAVEPPRSFLRAVAGIPEGDEAVLFHPFGEVLKFNDWVRGLNANASLHLFIGPEGGFTEAEVEAFRKGPGRRSIVKLGETVLKADTAFIGIATALRCFFS